MAKEYYWGGAFAPFLIIRVAEGVGWAGTIPSRLLSDKKVVFNFLDDRQDADGLFFLLNAGRSPAQAQKKWHLSHDRYHISKQYI